MVMKRRMVERQEVLGGQASKGKTRPRNFSLGRGLGLRAGVLPANLSREEWFLGREGMGGYL